MIDSPILTDRVLLALALTATARIARPLAVVSVVPIHIHPAVARLAHEVVHPPFADAPAVHRDEMMIAGEQGPDRRRDEAIHLDEMTLEATGPGHHLAENMTLTPARLVAIGHHRLGSGTHLQLEAVGRGHRDTNPDLRNLVRARTGWWNMLHRCHSPF